jgi:hypothetical protein
LLYNLFILFRLGIKLFISIQNINMKNSIRTIAFGLLCTLAAACGSGDTGESYNSTEAGDLNPNPNAGLTDSASLPPAGDMGNPDSSINVTPQGAGTDTGTTNINRGGAR